MSVDERELLQMYEIVTRIRLCDEKVRGLIMSGQLAVMWFPPRGQEVIAAATGVNLRADDYLVTTYRGVHDELAKGVPLELLWAEWLGKATGACAGRGGPMHITHPASGLMVTSGVVGGGLPIATGLGLASHLRDDGRVTVCSFGDGASNIGAFHEALNLAGVWKLPVVFLCQNNGYAESTPFAKATRVEHVADRAAAYGMPGVVVDGNDPVAMFEAARSAIQRARDGGGPTLLEAMTYRLSGHYFGDGMGYMPEDELAAALAADPVTRFRSWLVDNGHASDDDLAGVEDRIATEIAKAHEFARSSPDPDPDELHRDIYADAVNP